MRAPSTDLLRALRLAALPPPKQPICLAGHPTTSSLFRSFRTSSHLPAAEQPQSRSRPLPSSLSASSPSQPRSQVNNPHAPKTHDRGPTSKEETQTDFSKMDILTNAGAATPATSIDACTTDGFHLNNGIHTSGGMGVLLLDGEAFVWTPWPTNAGTTKTGFGSFVDKRGILTIPPTSLGILSLLYPKPDLLIVGTGRKLWMLSRDTRKFLSEGLGIRVDVMDTANAAAAYNLLAMERGVGEVGALMIPDGFSGA